MLEKFGRKFEMPGQFTKEKLKSLVIEKVEKPELKELLKQSQEDYEEEFVQMQQEINDQRILNPNFNEQIYIDGKVDEIAKNLTDIYESPSTLGEIEKDEDIEEAA